MSLCIITLLEKKIGGQWSGIKLHQGRLPKDIERTHMAEVPMRLCQAIKQSFNKPIILTRQFINCAGARRSLGWEIDQSFHDMIAKRMVQTNGFNLNTANKMITDIPYLGIKINAISVGDNNNPDLVISYAQPYMVMKLAMLFQQRFGTPIDLKLSSAMAVCGNVLAKAYNTQKIGMSFGCPESRDFGSISNDRLIIGIPIQIVNRLLNPT